MRLSVVNSKGGVGKTTVAVHLATLLARQGKTLLVDTDPKQAMAATWAEWRRDCGEALQSPTTIQLLGSAVLSEGRAMSRDYKHVVVDAGGRDSSGLRCALLLCETALVPVGASDFDSAALSDLLDVITEAREFNESLRVLFLLARIDSRTSDSRRMRKHLEQKGLAVMRSQVCERVAFRRATGEGKVVDELGSDQAAIFEMASAFREVMK